MPRRANKLFVKKLYLPDGKDKGQLDKMSRVTASASDLNQVATGETVTNDVNADVVTVDQLIVTTKTPVNEVAAVGTLTMTGIGVSGEILTIGSDIYELTLGLGVTVGTIEVDISGGGSAAQVVTAIVAASTGGTEPFTLTDGAGDTVVITADVAGVLANSTVLTTDFTNGTVDGTGTFADATVTGVDATVGAKGEIRWDASYIYVSVLASIISNGNWERAAIAAY